ncbi:MlaD family protein [Kiritimatiellaeota bacterium B1221]|nr:MlaD family protein [Kiritimatiellaeota bacterium B1221]
MSDASKKRNDVTTEIVVGAFMFIILVVLLTVSVVISQNKFFEKSYNLTAVFPNIGGLKEGEPIFLRGVKVGYVEDIEILTEGVGVNVKMRLTREFKIHEDYEIYVEASSMLGGMRLVINEGSQQLKVLTDDALENLEGTPAVDVLKEAGEVVAMLRKSLVEDGTLNSISEIANNLSEITGKINKGEGTIGNLVQDDQLYKDATELMSTLSAASKDLEQVAKDARVLSTRLAEGKGTFGKLLSEDEGMYDNLSTTLEEISVASGDARKIMARLEAGKGTIGKLLSEDDQIYNDLQEAMAALKQVSVALSEEKGTVGKLINDETLYIKVESLIDEARATIDDFRETSPITTFSSVFFGAF